MNKTDIEWCDATWNPVTGCRHGCEYCYARRIAERFGGYSIPGEMKVRHEAIALSIKGSNMALDMPKLKLQKNGKTMQAPYPFNFTPTLHRYRLDEPYQRKGQTIFVCSMADLFGRWVPTSWIKDVLDACLLSPQHRYLFLTKNPARYLELDKVALLPHRDNFWYGSTVPDETSQAMCPKTEGINAFWSLEPLLGPVDITKGEGMPQWIILGAMTGPGSAKRQPQREWVEDIVTAVNGAGIPVFMKDSLIPIVGEEHMRRDFPW